MTAERHQRLGIEKFTWDTSGDERVRDEHRALDGQVFSYDDIIFRLGGDEFIVFIANLKSSNLHMIDEKLQEICKIMNKEIIHMGHCQTISLSIGGVVTNQVHDFLELYHEADNMLYEVKRNGRNGFKIKNI